ncbi:RagB/SusD family nutrient uptake outer membrane protein [Algoriphagus sp. NG3]|uniref:RagB/SusD family nutrient uptake outer membrane protein n=1 Tax=Algoriphagus sp. NG3 TaxID=3097546 RepID=UPI002A7EC35F|nr:RagB/SusD family nutrient uptake outer membrane protein [Algoriphagus sp. NG3]WPR73836.1 RagB/SusD family nutrient uptake outer membrane protein [Algoriphagus sp. NG3]
MKKSFIKIALLGSIMFSCQDFLEEEMVAVLTQERYETAAGIEELVNGAYEGLRFFHNYEWAYTLTNYGTDEFTNGGGTDQVMWNTYTGLLAPTETSNLAPLWDNMYSQINLTNTGIRNIPVVFGNDPTTVQLRDTRLGEVHFFRGFSYLKLVEQFGDVPLKLTPTESDESDFPRDPKSEVMKVVMSDLRAAAALLPATASQPGRLTKAAAQHFLAKAYLFRASERNEDITVTTDLDSAAYFADEVILNSGKTLAPSFEDLFHYTAPNGPNEMLSEIILASQFDDTQALLGRYGNQTHMYFLSVYRFFPGMTRDLQNGREFQRLLPTDFALDNFDMDNDSRLFKSFQGGYVASNSNSVPTWTESNAPSPDLVGELKFQPGDTAAIMVINKKGDTRFTPGYKDTFAPLIIARHSVGADGSESTDYDISTYPSLLKYSDPFRTNFNDAKGTRDGIIARLGETYLIAAEAYGRKGDYGKALTYVNAIRERAAYKEGEDRGRVYYLSTGNSYEETGSTVGEMMATEDAFTPGTIESQKEIYPAGVSGKSEMFIHFILNEKARELLGEFHRWVDLSRTKTLVQRGVQFNADAAPNLREFHELRPVPQGYLDALQKDGTPLDSDEKTAMQNPGY